MEDVKELMEEQDSSKKKKKTKTGKEEFLEEVKKNRTAIQSLEMSVQHLVNVLIEQNTREKSIEEAAKQTKEQIENDEITTIWLEIDKLKEKIADLSRVIVEMAEKKRD